MDSKKTGTLIAARRRELELTQRQLAGALHVSDRAVSRWERGVGFPDPSLWEPLAGALGLSVVELLHGERVSPEERPAPALERSLREAFQNLGRRLRRLRRLLLLLGGLLACALLGLLLLWLHPDRYYVNQRTQVTAARAAEACPFSLITGEEFQVAWQLLQDEAVIQYRSDQPEPPGITVLDDETADPYRAMLHISGAEVDWLELSVYYRQIWVDYTAGARRCILTIQPDGTVLKTACAYDSRGHAPVVVENTGNELFYLNRERRDLLAPLTGSGA